MKSVLLPVAALMLAGCAGGHLYPVQGPLAAKTPPPVYQVKMENGDQINARIAGGEMCRGVWLDLVKEDPTVRDMAADWDLIYGKGYFDANVLGHIGIARSTLKCTKTGNMKVEFDSTKGVAQDDAGNVFRLTF
jgi:hypothetical protein